jgi:outer membrane protein assembly factor BamB
MTFGGMVGNEMPNVAYYTGLSYEQMFKPPVIINGYLYYNLYKSTYGYAPYNYPGFVCVDLSTGQEVWRNNDAWIDFGQIYDYESPNQAGATAYLWMLNGTTWTMMEAFTGQRILDIANAPSPGGMFGSTSKAGPHGEVYVYVLDATTNTLAMWNSYKAIGPFLPTGSEAWQWRPYSKISPLDGTQGYEWNVSIAAANIPGLGIAQIGPGDVLYAGAGGGFLSQFGNNKWAAFDANTGALLYTTTIQRDANLPGSSTGPIGDGVYTEYTRQTLQWNGYDIKTGQHLWTTVPYTDDWALYGSYMGQMIANGMLYHCGYDGYVHAFDVKTGQSVWNYYSGNAGMETPYGTYPFYGQLHPFGEARNCTP